MTSKKNLFLFIFILIGLCILVIFGYIYAKKGKLPATPRQGEGIPHQKEQTTLSHQLAIPKDQLLVFQSFVIPFKENRKFTYLSLSISFNLPNKELRREMIEKKHKLRGIIYDLLRVEIDKLNDVPSLEKLKEVLITGVNVALTRGKVNELYITEFLAV